MPARNALKTARQVAIAALAVALACVGATLLPAPWSWVALAAVLTVAAGATLFVLDMVLPGASLLSRAMSRLPEPRGRRVVLTFDDGPTEPFTRQILDVLDQHGAKATFFCIGQNVRANPELAAEIVRRGHDVGNHSESHALLPLSASSRVREEIARGAEALEESTGARPHWLRCPKGYKSRRVQRIAGELGQTLVGFSYPVYDMGDPPPDELAERVLARAAPGDILLMHDGVSPRKPGQSRDSLVRALPAILEGLRERDLEPVSLGEALEPEGGKVRAGKAVATR